MNSDTTTPASNVKNFVARPQTFMYKEVKDITAAEPWIPIVIMVSLNKEFSINSSRCARSVFDESNFLYNFTRQFPLSVAPIIGAAILNGGGEPSMISMSTM